ncbi:hypothetical protein [Halorarius halobius]|uniref:hypothetical protein n=1 Tax=Halorarius halobius TaxID=2962671 RepID=UPI0020CD2356|nr:hypothetical protein [Halorarius halobius]
MSTAGRPNASAPAESLAAAVRDAGFVRLAGTADGDALAAVGVLARAFRATDIPFKASVRRVPRDDGTEADVVVGVGADVGDVSVTDEPLAATAFEAARKLGADPDAMLALAGAVAAGAVPGEDAPLYEAADSRLERRPGVAVPVADLADGLAHSTLVHADFSGDGEAATAALAELDLPADLDADAHRRLASMVALRAVDEAADRAGEAVERALRPYAGGPFETLGGYADVLDACARVAPGTGVALALGHEPSGALDAWREHGRRAHAAVRESRTERHRGVVVVHAEGDAPLGTVARLTHAYRSPEPLVLAVADGEAAAHGAGAFEALDRAATAADATATGRHATGHARDVDREAFVTALREAV